jgi:peptidoglycan/xylan/chitin deacetylase (PgdA/CDA1 family)
LIYPLVNADVIKSSPVISLCKKPGMFAMTFVGGPSILTGNVLDALEQRKVKASFIPVISHLNDVSIVANLQRAAQDGHLIGLCLEQSLNSTAMRGPTDASTSNYADLLKAVDERASIVQGYIGYKPRFLSIPDYTAWGVDALDAIVKHGYVITTYDYRDTDILRNFKSVLDTLSPNTKGAFISVQRDGVAASVNQTGAIIDYIIEKGYRLVMLDECVGSAMNTNSNAGGSQRTSTTPSRSTAKDPAMTASSAASSMSSNTVYLSAASIIAIHTISVVLW